MKPKWIIEDFAPANEFARLADEVRRQGMECEVVVYEPLQMGSFDAFGDEGCVLFQGSMEEAQRLQRIKRWIPGPWLTPKNYECTKYYAHLGDYLFNDTYIMLPRGDLLRKLDWLYDSVFHGFYTLFFRPSSGMKPFTAAVYSKFDLVSVWDFIRDYTEPESLIVVSTPKIVKAEWRFVCSKGDVLTGCQYEKQGKIEYQPGYPEEARALAEEVCKQYEPDPIFVVDICLTENGTYRLMEINSFSCGGLYACEMEPIVTRAAELAGKEWEEYQKPAD